VGTVDSFQGQGLDIIAITLTRSNPPRRDWPPVRHPSQSVGITRVRRKLLLVGDPKGLGFAVFVASVGPGLAEKQCPGFDFVPVKTHLVIRK
jgi:hypothetical protein